MPLKGLNGLQHSGYSWAIHRTKVLTKHGWVQSPYNPAIFYRDSKATGITAPHNNEGRIILQTTVDDFQFTGIKAHQEALALKDELNLRLENIDNSGDIVQFTYTNNKVIWNKKEGTMTFDQESNVKDVVTRFNGKQTAPSPAQTPIASTEPPHEFAEVNDTHLKFKQQVAGSINYLTTVSRPDLALAGRVIASMKSTEHAKRALRYMRETHRLRYFSPGNRNTYVAQTLREAALAEE